MAQQIIKDSGKDTFVAIGASVGGIFMVIAIMFLLFAKDHLGILVPLAWAFVVLGIAMGFFAYKARKQK